MNVYFIIIAIGTAIVLLYILCLISFGIISTVVSVNSTPVGAIIGLAYAGVSSYFFLKARESLDNKSCYAVVGSEGDIYAAVDRPIAGSDSTDVWQLMNVWFFSGLVLMGVCFLSILVQ